MLSSHARHATGRHGRMPGRPGRHGPGAHRWATLRGSASALGAGAERLRPSEEKMTVTESLPVVDAVRRSLEIDDRIDEQAPGGAGRVRDRKSTRLNSSHGSIS